VGSPLVRGCCGEIATSSSTNTRSPRPPARDAEAAGASRRSRRKLTRQPTEGHAPEQETRKEDRAPYGISRGAWRLEKQRFFEILSGIVVSLILGRRSFRSAPIAGLPVPIFWSLSERPATLRLPPRGGPEKKSPHRLSHPTALVTRAVNRNVKRRPPRDNLPGNQTTENDTSSIVATLGLNTSGTTDCDYPFESPGSRATTTETVYSQATIGHNHRSAATGRSTTGDRSLEITQGVDAAVAKGSSTCDTPPEGSGDADRASGFLHDHSGSPNSSNRLHRHTTFSDDQDSNLLSMYTRAHD